MKIGKCSGCNEDDKPIVNSHFNLCDKCNKKRLNENKKKPAKKYNYIKKPTGERELFLEIWEERADANGNHYCKYCDKPLGDEPLAGYFSHRKAKSLGKEFRLNKENIDIICMECHQEHEFKKKKE